MSLFRMRSLVLFVALWLLCLLSLPLGSSSSTGPGVCRVAQRVAAARKRSVEARRPNIHFWDTEGVNYEMYGIWFGPNAYLQCPVDCSISAGRDATRLSRSESVLFWATPLQKGLELSQKCPGSIWLQASTEAFDVHILDRTPPGGVMPANGEPSPIDLEVSWRRTLGKEKVSWMNNYDWNLDFTRAFDDEFAAPLSISTKTRTGRDLNQAAVAAFISNCGAVSPRLEMLEELQKYIPVDSFGRCAHNKDVPDHWHAEKDLSRGVLIQKNTILKNRYKFLLAFENQEIEDYVTEKYVRR